MSVSPMHSLLRRGCFLCLPPARSVVNPRGGEPPTGEPDAGEPPVRFGGRGNHWFSLPLLESGKAAMRKLKFFAVDPASGILKNRYGDHGQHSDTINVTKCCADEALEVLVAAFAGARDCVRGGGDSGVSHHAVQAANRAGTG